MNHSQDELAEFLEAQLAGEHVDVPERLRDMLGAALAGHQALADMLTVASPETVWDGASRQPPQLPPDYEIQAELGHGGMGVVYRARQHSLQRDVAIKVLRPGEQAPPAVLARFLAEARHLAQLRHPGIVAIYEVGDAAGEPYFTMDYIAGETLSKLLRQGPLIPSRAIELFRQIAEALQYAHRQGIIHRDLKPGNILLNPSGQAFVTDFGLARNLLGEASHTRTGELLGTPQYMAPEQARGQAELVGEATDLHALGLLLYEMLTGQPAFQAASPADLLVQVLHHEPASLRRIDRRIPRDLETICLKCLQKSPADRYSSVTALLEDLRRFSQGESLVTRPPSLLARGYRWLVRHWKLLGTAVLTAGLMLAFVMPLLDRSFADLVSWGDEELATGHPEVAAQIYSRAWQKGTEAEQRQLVGRIVQTCRVLPSSPTVVDLALPVLELTPDVSFGDHDVLIAQALLTKHRAASPTGSIDIWRDQPTPELDRVRKRLELALARGDAGLAQLELEQNLLAIKTILAEDRPYVRYEPDHLYQLPQGTPAELRALLQAEQTPLWTKARAAIALARQLRKEGDPVSALARYREAYELVQRVYPYYSGVYAATGAAGGTAGVPEAEECRLVWRLISELRELDSQAAPVPKGQVSFQTEGIKLPASLQLAVTVELSEPGRDNLDAGLSHNLPRRVPLHPAVPATLGVIQGTYQLRLRGWNASWKDADERFVRLLQVEAPNWPDTITVQGGPIQLPPVRLRMAEEIQLHQPAPGAAVNLNTLELAWKPCTAAHRYRVTFSYTTENPSPVTSYFLTVWTAEPRLLLTELQPHQLSQLAENLPVGRTAGWKVDALDSADRVLGTTLQESRFLVATALDQGE